MRHFDFSAFYSYKNSALNNNDHQKLKKKLNDWFSSTTKEMNLASDSLQICLKYSDKLIIKLPELEEYRKRFFNNVINSEHV